MSGLIGIAKLRKEKQVSTKIISLQAENVKRVKAVMLSPSATGLTIIGGRNGQGKTSVLDAIVWALGGERYRPSEPRRDGSVLPPFIKIELSNGLLVERKGKNSSLSVIDPQGSRAGQKLVDSFVEELALNLPKFMEGSPKDKARTLLEIIGVGDKLYEFDDKEAQLYSRRHEIGQIAEQKQKAAEELPSYEGAPEEPISASELIKEQQDILTRNGENARKKRIKADLETELERVTHEIFELENRKEQLRSELELATVDEGTWQDRSTAELEASIASIDETNSKVRANQDKARLAEEAAGYQAQYEALTAEIEGVRSERLALLEGADLPMAGLSVADGELTYKGYKWDNLSGSEQLRISTAIVRKLKPECGFILLDKIEQFDLETLKEFGAWLEAEGLQAIATRVSTGSECSVIIEDGYAGEATVEKEKEEDPWK